MRRDRPQSALHYRCRHLRRCADGQDDLYPGGRIQGGGAAGRGHRLDHHRAVCRDAARMAHHSSGGGGGKVGRQAARPILTLRLLRNSGRLNRRSQLRCIAENIAGTRPRMYAYEMTAEPNFEIHARDGTAMIVLRRNTREAAQKKAEELRDMGWFDVEIVELPKSQAA